MWAIGIQMDCIDNVEFRACALVAAMEKEQKYLIRASREQEISLDLALKCVLLFYISEIPTSIEQANSHQTWP
jgi:hypothetical protein